MLGEVRTGGIDNDARGVRAQAFLNNRYSNRVEQRNFETVNYITNFLAFLFILFLYFLFNSHSDKFLMFHRSSVRS